MDQSSMIFWKMIFGVIGFGFFSYGKKQKAPIPFLVGCSLFIFPYFVSNLSVLLATGVLLIIIPYFIRFPRY